MRIDVTVVIPGVDQADRPLIEWPRGWPVPTAGDPMEIPGLPAAKVGYVEWWPKGDPDNGEPEPFVHVIVTPA